MVGLTAPRAFAQTTITVNTPADEFGIGGSALCSLREAIQTVNSNTDFGGCFTGSGPYTIDVPADTYILVRAGTNEDFNATGDLDISSDLTITGAGANTTTVNGGGIDRVIDIRGDSTVSISGLTVTGGVAPDLGGLIIGAGGGISTQGTLLTLTNVTVRGNSAQSSTDPSLGGGISKNGQLILNNCTVSNNSASFGGGISNYIGGPLTLNNSTVSDNSGGAIHTSNHGPTIYLNNSTLSGNYAQSWGGLYQQTGTVVMKNTILANGGGNCYFAGNSPGGGLISLGHNLSTDVWCLPVNIVSANVSGGLDGPGDINDMSAGLAPLFLNPPGSTETHALLPGSLAIDAVPLSSYTVCTDQRGVSRPQGSACDIGAFESTAAGVPPPNCDDGKVCTDDSCDPVTGDCVHVDNTAPCNDGDGCTQTDTCQAGNCVGNNPVICTALDPCHVVGVCDPDTGLCSNPPASDGTNCDDGDVCTQIDKCQNGSCIGSDLVVCTALDQCHQVGVCDPDTGCSNPPAPDFIDCNDGDVCTTNDKCVGGVCRGNPPPPPPSNDLCSGAKTVPNGTYLFNTCGATTSSAPPACTPVNLDVWYRWVAPPTCGGTVTVDTCGSLFDTALIVHRDSCAGPQVGCNNNAAAGSCNGSSQSFVSFQATPNTAYFIRVGAFPAPGVAGSGRITISGPYPNPTGCTCPSGAPSPGTTQLYQFVGTANGAPGAWCLRAPCCFQCEDRNVPGATNMVALLNNFVASVNNKGCGGNLLATVVGNPIDGRFTIRARCGLNVPFQFRVGQGGGGPTSACGALSVVVPPGAVLNVPAQYNPDVYEIPLPGVDCNGNDEDDMIDILAGTSLDADGDDIPDECRSIPTVSQWGLVVLLLGGLCMGTIMFGRRRRAGVI